MSDYCREKVKEYFRQPQESEDEDERIRKAIKEAVEYYWSDNTQARHDIFSWLEKQGEQKSAWSKEDEDSRDIAIRIIQNGGDDCSGILDSDKALKWLKSLKDRVVPQGEQESLCDKCRKEQPSHSCQDITELGRCAVEHEQKPANKVEPKFKVGDWIVTPRNEIKQISEVTFGNYWLTDGDLYNIIDVDNHGHLWSIQDARAGDVLLSKYNQPFIYNGIFDKESIGAYCGIDSSGNEFLSDTSPCNWSCKEGVKPATKGQRDLLFKKMKDVGYEWHANEKELRGIPDIQSENV